MGMRVTEVTGPGYLSVPWGWKVHLWLTLQGGCRAWNWEEQLRVFTVMPGVVQPSPLVPGQKAPLRGDWGLRIATGTIPRQWVRGGVP